MKRKWSKPFPPIPPILPPGPTGRFPDGKLDPTDEGELRIIVSAWRGQVRIDFGTPIDWLAMPPEQARKLADAIRSHADKAMS